MPEAGAGHVLDGALLPIGQPDPGPPAADAGALPAFVARLFRTLTGRLRAGRARRGQRLDAGARSLPADGAGFRLERVPIPLRIEEVLVRLDEVEDREVVLPLEEARAAADDLLEFNHRVDRTHEHNGADVAGVYTGGEFLGGGQDGRNGAIVILEFAQVLFAEFAIVGGDADAVHRVGVGFDLVDQVAGARGFRSCG